MVDITRYLLALAIITMSVSKDRTDNPEGIDDRIEQEIEVSLRHLESAGSCWLLGDTADDGF